MLRGFYETLKKYHVRVSKMEDAITGYINMFPRRYTPSFYYRDLDEDKSHDDIMALMQTLFYVPDVNSPVCIDAD